MELAVYNTEGQDTGKKVTLSDTIFNIEPNDHAIYLDTKQYMANQRQGTHKSKERAEISGSTRKLKKQKGTGTARSGSIKSPVFRGGGRIFGPRPRNYSFKLNKKVKQLARKSALTYKMKSENIAVIENINIEQPKTKEFINIQNKFPKQGRRTLVVLESPNKNVYLSARNIPDVKIITASNLNTYDILKASTLILVENSVEEIHKMFKEA